MLVLSRKPGQRIFIGNDISVTVVAVSGNHVRLGFQAPQHMPIRREEICFQSPLIEEPAPADGSKRFRKVKNPETNEITYEEMYSI